MKIFFKVLIILFSFYNLQKPSSLVDSSVEASKTVMNDSMDQQSGAGITIIFQLA